MNGRKYLSIEYWVLGDPFFNFMRAEKGKNTNDDEVLR